MSGPITPELLLSAYAAGAFPMAESRDAREVFWLAPRRRGIIPLDGFHISRSLARRIRRGDYRVTIDTAFGDVVDACADRPETWINADIRRLYLQLFSLGHAHSVEVWMDGALAGGLYGVSLGGAFFGESMFSRRTDGSKIALAYLVSRLRAGGYLLLDTQFLTDHLASLGGIEISREDYHRRLEKALAADADFFRQPPDVSPSEVLQLRSQTS